MSQGRAVAAVFCHRERTPRIAITLHLLLLARPGRTWGHGNPEHGYHYSVAADPGNSDLPVHPTPAPRRVGTLVQAHGRIGERPPGRRDGHDRSAYISWPAVWRARQGWNRPAWLIPIPTRWHVTGNLSKLLSWASRNGSGTAAPGPVKQWLRIGNGDLPTVACVRSSSLYGQWQRLIHSS